MVKGSINGGYDRDYIGDSAASYSDICPSEIF